VSDRLTRAENTSHQDIKKDALVTWAFHAGDWAQNNLRTIGIAAGIAVIAVLGSVWISRAQGRAEADANLVLAEASVSYWQGNYVRTIQLSDQVMSGFKTTKAANEARRMKADALFWQGAFDSSAILYKEYLAKDRTDSPVRLAVQQSLAFTLGSKKDYAEAAKLYEEIAGKAPDRNSVADFLMAAARSYRAANQPEKSKALYEKVTLEYKDTTYGRDAEVMLGELMAQGAAH